MTNAALDAARYFMLKHLAAEDAFADVPGRVLQHLVDLGSLHELAKGASIYDAGRHWPHVGFIVDGSVAMLAPGEDERERLYDQATPGDFFGISAMFDREPTMAKTIAVSKHASYVRMDVDPVLQLCKEHGSLAVAFAITLARRVRRTTSLLAAEMNLSANQRIALYLLNFSAGAGLQRVRDPLPEMTQIQIGAAAGTVKEVVGRAVTAFEQKGALKREKGRIHWLNREKLMEVAAIPPHLVP